MTHKFMFTNGKWVRADSEQTATLRGHAPVMKWVKDYGACNFGVVEIFKMKSGLGKGNYFVEVWKNGNFSRQSKSFKEKKNAVAYAKRELL